MAGQPVSSLNLALLVPVATSAAKYDFTVWCCKTSSLRYATKRHNSFSVAGSEAAAVFSQNSIYLLFPYQKYLILIYQCLLWVQYYNALWPPEQIWPHLCTKQSLSLTADITIMILHTNLQSGCTTFAAHCSRATNNSNSHCHPALCLGIPLLLLLSSLILFWKT